MEVLDIKTEEIKDIDKLKKIMLSDNRRCLYRGQRDSLWGLVPNIYRKENVEDITKYLTRDDYRKKFEEKKTITRAILRNTEIGLIINFLKHCHYISLRLPSGAMRVYEKYAYEASRPINWPNYEELDILSIMQHYSFPTRLLDWSHNMLIAFFFAAKPHVIHGNSPGSFSIWEFDQVKFIGIKKRINLEVRRNSNSDDSQTIRKKYTDFIDGLSGFRVFKSDSEINKNLGAQKGCFTYIRNQKTAYYDNLQDYRIPHDDYIRTLIIESEKLEKYKNDIEKFIYDEAKKLKLVLKKYIIANELAIDVIKLLEKLGYNQSALFPSYEGVLAQIELDVAIKLSNK
ncbi:FRG domain-containing protein [Providencia rettgeri]|uniref:FRG domain-containing protein n=1 Tax=Providencia rettgeri TaxID=587 RepID=UPI000E3E4DAE|nr:FRG domain-containing protein [Providencia rettgeri]RFT11906.1 FRG domain-containing protein [Providencia rettgeri]